jgi:hypothetical protein
MAGYLAGHNAPSVSYGGSRACYSPSADRLSLPERSSFESAETFYSTAFHELTHSTGHASRLARKDLLEFHRFGDASYSREELVAEMGAAMLSAVAGIHQTTVPLSAAYLASWLKVLRGDSRMIVTAAAQAQKAADMGALRVVRVGEHARGGGSVTIHQLFAADLSESEGTRLRRDLETYRGYLAGACTDECETEDHPHHRHWTDWYERNRAVIVELNMILEGDFDRDFWTERTANVATEHAQDLAEAALDA